MLRSPEGTTAPTAGNTERTTPSVNAAGNSVTGCACNKGKRKELSDMDKKYLGLIGPEDSVYLRLIQREAEKALEEVE